MTNEKLIELINQIEQNAGSLIVRERDQSVSLIELPTHLAIKHFCRILRKRVKYANGETPIPEPRFSPEFLEEG